MIVFVHRVRIIICLRDSVAFLAARLLSLRCDTHTLSRTCTALGQTCTCVLARARTEQVAVVIGQQSYYLMRYFYLIILYLGFLIGDGSEENF